MTALSSVARHQWAAGWLPSSRGSDEVLWPIRTKMVWALNCQHLKNGVVFCRTSREWPKVERNFWSLSAWPHLDVFGSCVAENSDDVILSHLFCSKYSWAPVNVSWSETPRSGFMGLWATWSSCRCSCPLQRNWTGWLLKFPSNSGDSMIAT